LAGKEMAAETMRAEIVAGHSRFFMALCLVSLALALVANSQQYLLGLLAILVLTVGVPHGSLDHLCSSNVFPKLSWLQAKAVFLVLYAAMAAAVVVIWVFTPVVSLAAFLAISIYHFGSDDNLLPNHDSFRPLESATRGLLPIVFPALYHSCDVQNVFVILSGPQSTHLAQALGLLGLPATMLWLAVLTRAFRQRQFLLFFELGLLGLSLMTLPLYLGFAVFFCGLHSLRQLLLLAYVHSKVGLLAVFRQGALITFITGLTAALAFLCLGGSADEDGARIIFVGLAAVSWPHISLHRWLLSRSSMDGGQV
jgi:Brp/Blh family beta-carotene 15,15'-monooxygenase